MDKEEVINTHNGILPSHKKEQNGVTCRDMDGPRMSYKVKFKSEREKQISNIKHIHGIWKNGIYDPFCKAENKDTDIGNKYMDTKGEGEGEETGKLELTHIHY